MSIKVSMRDSLEKRYKENPEFFQLLLQKYEQGSSDKAFKKIEACVLQPWHRFPDSYDKAFFIEMFFDLDRGKTGSIHLCSLDCGPGNDGDMENKVILESAFKDPRWEIKLWYGSHDCDGALVFWKTDKREGRPDDSIPIEIGTSEITRLFMHLHEGGSFLKWGYNCEYCVIWIAPFYIKWRFASYDKWSNPDAWIYPKKQEVEQLGLCDGPKERIRSA